MSHDPLSVLQGDDLPVRPDPEFAARLRRRLESALSLPPGAEGVVMSDTDTAIDELLQSAQTQPAAVPHSAPRRTALPGRRRRTACTAVVRRCVRCGRHRRADCDG